MSAYRSSASSDRVRGAVLCVACGARLSLGPRDVELECWRCRRAQPALRDDPSTPYEVSVVSVDARPYEELVPFLRTIGVHEQALGVRFRLDGVEVAASLSLNSGTVDGLYLSAVAEGLPELRLSREGAAERDAKASGLTREVQTGDAGFDDEVFIDAAIADEDVRFVLASPAVRAAIRELLRDFKAVQLRPKLIDLEGGPATPRCFEPARIRAWLAALRVIAGAPRPAEIRVVARTAAQQWIRALTFLGAPLALLTLVGTAVNWAPVRWGWLAGLGVAVGLLPWRAVIALVRPALAGRSSSHRDVRWASALSFVAISATSVSAAFSANALCDQAAEREEVGTVTKATYDDEDHDMRVRGRAGELELDFRVYDVGRTIRVGDRLRVWSKPGALGAPWTTRPIVVEGACGHCLQK